MPLIVKISKSRACRPLFSDALSPTQLTYRYLTMKNFRLFLLLSLFVSLFARWNTAQAQTTNRLAERL
jgi:hypothetical protein